MDASNHLLENMVLFARLLRAGSLEVTPLQLQDWLRATRFIDLTQRDDFHAATRSILVSREADLAWFESAFHLFWQFRDPRELEKLEMGLLVQQVTERTERLAAQRLAPRTPAAENESGASENGDGGKPQTLPMWGERDVLRRKDFADLSADELAEAKRLIAHLRIDLPPRKSRRQRAHRRGRGADLRRTLRAAIARDGEMLPLRNRRQIMRPRPLVLLADVSGSMEPYARLLLRFVATLHRNDRPRRGALSGYGKVEAFAFGTRLTRITRQLEQRDVDEALKGAQREIEDWGGGTKTGFALERFHRDWARRVLGRGAVVLIISDGWDRGDPVRLAREMARLSRRCHRLIWLNPLLGSPRYRPLTRGMQAALPWIDDFLPVHNLNSLEQLAVALAQLGRGVKASRRQALTNTFAASSESQLRS